MIAGASKEARWFRAEPRRTLARAIAARIVQAAFPGSRLLSMAPFAGGCRNANFKLELDRAPSPVVLRVYEHHSSLCQKEVDLYRLIGPMVPVPEVYYAEPNGWEGMQPFAVFSFIEGVSFREVKRSGDRELIARAAFAVGETVASFGKFQFHRTGWLAPGPAVSSPLLEGADPVPRFVDLCLASRCFQLRATAGLRDRLSALVWSWAPELAELEREPCLVHGDLGKQNVLVRLHGDAWKVSAVLDWEYAITGSPLVDVGHLLRYEGCENRVLEPHFSGGFRESGGRLPESWREIASVLDLAALCESLTHEDLPAAVATELVELVHRYLLTSHRPDRAASKRSGT